jgi:pimeloyl-ACP methyl ester carboxylesterase
VTTFVLVHGAWGRPEQWSYVIDALGDGARGVAADLPTCQRGDATFDDDVACVRALVRDAGDDVVLVGQSYGGTVVSAVDEANVRALVYVAALMLDETETLFDVVSGTPANPEGEPPDFRDDGTAHVKMNREQDEQRYSADGLARLYRYEPRPWAYAAALAKVSEPAWQRRRSTYVVATRDLVVSTSEQRRMSQRATTVIELDSDHMVHIEMPDRIAEILLAAAQ